MFKCDNCGKQTGKLEKQNSIVVPRHKEYKNERLVYDEKTRKKKKEYFYTEGLEVGSELKVCDECFKKHEKENSDGNKEGTRGSNQSPKRRSSEITGRSKNSSLEFRKIRQEGLRSELRG